MLYSIIRFICTVIAGIVLFGGLLGIIIAFLRDMKHWRDGDSLF